MKALILTYFLISSSCFAETLDLKSAQMEYQVKHLLKRVSGQSKELKGRMECGEKECEFLLGAQVKSFVSSDSNRDLNMQTTAEASKYPVTSARGKIGIDLLKKAGSFEHPVEVDFHGVKKVYQARTEVKGENNFVSKFTLKLDAHKIERPSLFGVRIDDEVPMVLESSWVKK